MDPSGRRHNPGPLYDSDPSWAGLGFVDLPPKLHARFFYDSTFSIDEPRPAKKSADLPKCRPRPFSSFDHAALEKAWLRLQRPISPRRLTWVEQRSIRYHEKIRIANPVEVERSQVIAGRVSSERAPKPAKPLTGEKIGPRMLPLRLMERVASNHSNDRASGSGSGSDSESGSRANAANAANASVLGNDLANPINAEEAIEETSNSGAPVRQSTSSFRRRSRIRRWRSDNGPENSNKKGPYQSEWNAGQEPLPSTCPTSWSGLPMGPPIGERCQDRAIKVPVGNSRPHMVNLQTLQMKPVDDRSMNNVLPVVRGTWFYKKSMAPVPSDIANQLELGYERLQPWSRHYRIESSRCARMGPSAQVKFIHWLGSDLPPQPEKTDLFCEYVATGCLESTSAQDYKGHGVIYGRHKDAQILKPSRLPSKNAWCEVFRGPLEAILDGKSLGEAVIRGFDRARWAKADRQAKAKQRREMWRKRWLKIGR